MVTKFHLGHLICLTFFKIMEDCFSVLCIVPTKHVYFCLTLDPTNLLYNLVSLVLTLHIKFLLHTMQL